MAVSGTLTGAILPLNACEGNYGSNMQASSLADWTEYCALKGKVAPWHSVREFMREAGVPPVIIDQSYGDEAFVNGQLFDDMEERAALDGDAALQMEPTGGAGQDTAHRLICQRAQYLGDSYPFEFDEFNRLRLKERVDIEHNPYIMFLRISILKGWLYPSDKTVLLPITNLFEQLIAASMRCAGLRAAVVGTSKSEGFDIKLRKSASSIGLDCDPHAVEHSPYAKDEGVDIIGGCIAQDHRIGEPIWLIQAACGKSGNDWENKLMHIDPGKWSRYLCSRSHPYAFLAVPYHLTEQAIEGFMHYGDTRSFLDRLRLVHMAGLSMHNIDKSTQKMADDVLELETEWWRKLI